MLIPHIPRAKTFKDCIEILEKMLMLEPNNIDNYYNLCITHVQAGQREEAKVILEKISKMDKDVAAQLEDYVMQTGKYAEDI